MSKIYVDTVEPEGATTVLTLGASGDTINIAGTAGTGFPSGGFDSFQVKTGSVAWTKPAGITKIVVEVLGGGGSGGGASAVGRGGGGGAGGYVLSDVIDVSGVAGSTSLSIGGAGPTPTANSTGNAGGETSTEIAGVTLTAGGGGAGIAGGTRGGGAGGTASGGKINLVGQGGSTYISTSAHGGNTKYGWGGRTPDTGTSATGPAATGYGAGGGGARGDEGGAGSSGGAAVPGLIVVWEYK